MDTLLKGARLGKLALVVGVLGLAACTAEQGDGARAATGAATAAGVTLLTGGDTRDVAAAAALGGVLGAQCDDINAC